MHEHVSMRKDLSVKEVSQLGTGRGTENTYAACQYYYNITALGVHRSGLAVM